MLGFITSFALHQGNIINQLGIKSKSFTFFLKLFWHDLWQDWMNNLVCNLVGKILAIVPKKIWRLCKKIFEQIGKKYQSCWKCSWQQGRMRYLFGAPCRDDGRTLERTWKRLRRATKFMAKHINPKRRRRWIQKVLLLKRQKSWQYFHGTSLPCVVKCLYFTEYSKLNIYADKAFSCMGMHEKFIPAVNQKRHWHIWNDQNFLL